MSNYLSVNLIFGIFIIYLIMELVIMPQILILHLRTLREKYIKIYKEFISQLCMDEKAIWILSKGYLPISLLPPLKLQEILDVVKKAIQIIYPDYDIVIKRLHLYYNIKLVTFGIDKGRNLIIQFPIFIQTYTQQLLTLYQLESSTSSHCRSK